MTQAGDPFQQQPADPFGGAAGPPTISYAHPAPELGQFAPASVSPRPQSPPYNTLAVLSPIMAVLVPPAGVVLGHLALARIRRTAERGWVAAICGLVLGYLMCVALLAGAIWFATTGHTRSTSASPTTAPWRIPPTSVVTSMAPAAPNPRIKLDLAQATVGTCVEIQLRGNSSEDALDLFKVPCVHRDGVYTVVARGQNDSDCNTTYVAAPPDHTFAVCLNRY